MHEPDTIAKIRALHASGHNGPSISRALGIPYSTVYRHLNADRDLRTHDRRVCEAYFLNPYLGPKGLSLKLEMPLTDVVTILRARGLPFRETNDE